MGKPKLTRDQRLLALQHEYEKWSETVEFVTETSASDEDETAFMDRLLDLGLIEPSEDSKIIIADLKQKKLPPLLEGEGSGE
jgi:hypothetical protein